MKTIYSLNEFMDMVKQLADSVGIDYYTATVEVKSYEGIQFRAYVHTLGTFSGRTVEECIGKLRDKISPTANEIDVEIETVTA